MKQDIIDKDDFNQRAIAELQSTIDRIEDVQHLMLITIDKNNINAVAVLGNPAKIFDIIEDVFEHISAEMEAPVTLI